MIWALQKPRGWNALVSPGRGSWICSALACFHTHNYNLHLDMSILTNFPVNWVSGWPDMRKEKFSRSAHLGSMEYLLNMPFFLGISGVSDPVEVAKPSPQPCFALQHPSPSRIKSTTLENGLFKWREFFYVGFFVWNETSWHGEVWGQERICWKFWET